MEDKITEITELNPDKVSGVGSPANGTPWLFVKEQSVEDLGENDSEDEDDNDEVAMMSQVTKSFYLDSLVTLISTSNDYAKAMGPSESSQINNFLESLNPTIVAKAKLKAKERDNLPNSSFAYIDSSGGRHLPIQDAAHVRNALARFDQTHFESASARSAAKKKIKAKAKEFGIIVAKSKKNKKFKATKVVSMNEFDVKGGMTAGVNMPKPSNQKGGKSPYIIPAESKVNKGKASNNWVSVDAKNVTKDGDDDSVGPASTPGSPIWETYDASTLDSAARALTEVVNQVNQIKKREEIEAISGDQGDWLDAMQLSIASTDLNSALGLIAALAYHEAAEGVAKSLDKVIQKAKSTKENIMSIMTKEDLAALVAKSSATAVAKAMKETSKKAKKADKKADKKAKKENAIQAGEIRNMKPNGTDRNADDVTSVGKQLEDLAKAVAKISNQPQPNGPNLTGNLSKGLFGLGELEEVAKESDSKITVLAKQLEKTSDPLLKDRLGRELTLAKLQYGHAVGQI